MSADDGAVLELRQLTVGYGGPPVVRDLSLHVDAGEIVALFGPNGAGKTTTLSTVSGFLRPTHGDVLLRGSSLEGLAPQRIARSGIAHVPEDRGIFSGLTTRENLSIGISRSASAVDRVLEHFPALRPLLRRRAGLLSGGEQQMLAVGRALASEPQLLMIDELSHGLAPIIVQRLLPSIRAVALDLGCGVLLVEQHVQLALAYADRAYVLAHGSIVRSDDAEVLRGDVAALEAAYFGVDERDVRRTG